MNLEVAVGRVLRLGVAASSTCLGAGLVLALTAPGSRLANTLMTTGLILLLATPVARVLVSIVDYALERDWLFTLLTLIVMMELAASVVAAVYGRL
jgi:uncharacterized membrane protein